MAVLTMDTATHICAVAVGEDAVLAGHASLVPRGHSRVLQPAIASVLNTASLSARALTHIVLGVGPGSYTGVRLGVATAKAMASALQIPITPVQTLLGIAEAAAPYAVDGALALPLLYARRKRAFGAVYRKQGQVWETVVPVQVRDVAEWTNELERYCREGAPSATVVHDFEPKHGVLDVLPSRDAVCVRLSDIAGELAPALFRLYQHQSLPSVEGADVHHVVPDYALPVEAEARLAEKGRAEG